MKPEIKAMLSDFPLPCEPGRHRMYYDIDEIRAWLDKVFEGAVQVFSASELVWMDTARSATHTAILLKPQPIDNRVPLSEVIEMLENIPTLKAPLGSLDLAQRLKQYGVK